MAQLLYRLGRLSARRAWAFVLAWTLLLAGLGGAAATLMKPFSSSLSIPGTEFQSVLDDLEQAMPKAAGGSSTIVLTSAAGRAFTADQQRLVAEVTASWSALSGVDTARNPFTVQKQLDDAKVKVADAGKQLADGEEAIATNSKKLADGRAKIADGEKELTANAAKIADGRKKLDAAAAKVVAGQREIDKNAATLAAAMKKIVAGEKQLASGRKQLAAAKTKIANGEKQILAARKQIAAGQKKIVAGRTQIAAGQKQVTAALAQVATGERQLAAARAQQLPPLQSAAAAAQSAVNEAQAALEQAIAAHGADSAEAIAAQADLEGARGRLAQAQQTLAAVEGELDRQGATLAATRTTLEAKAAQLIAAKKTLEANAVKLATGLKTLNLKAKQLAAGKVTLATKTAELVAGAKKLAAGRAQAEAGQRKLAAAQTQLNAGRATIATNRATLDDGAKKLAAGRVTLAKAKADIVTGEQKIADAKKKIVTGTAALERGKSSLALTEGLRMVSESGTVALSQISFTSSLQEVTDETKDVIRAKAQPLTDAGVRVEYSKDLSEGLSFAGPGEAVGVIMAFVVLLVMLGSLVAAGLPLLTALIGVAIGLLGALTLTHWTTMTDVTPVLALMLGLAVGIDYALFLVNRHREQIATGMELEESIGVATGTAGSAVVVAGATVVVALGALTLSGIPFLGTMGLVAAATVAIAVLVSITLTPALLRLIGHRVLSRRGRRAIAERIAAEEAEADAEDSDDRSERAPGEEHGIEPGDQAVHALHDATEHRGRGRGWGGFVTRHPVATLLVTTVLLGVLAIPAMSLRLGLPDGSSESPDTTAYRAYAATAEAFGAGQNGPMLAVAKVSPDVAGGLSADALTDLEIDVAQRIKATEGVKYVVPAGASTDQKTLIFQIVPETGPTEDATTTLVHALRTGRAAIVEETDVDSIGFAGSTVANIDISERLASALPGYLGVVVGISLLLLLLVFRSIVVPVLATAGFLLSIAAAFGSVVAVYQWGWLGSLFGVHHPGVILSFLPTLAIGILFGLAMDYQMFLVSGMREAWSHGHTARTAVRTGFAHGARVVTAAALIMTSVFASFIFSHLAMIKPIGFALAIGVLFDAFIVRMTAIPAIMHILGEKAWYIPRWLDRLLPDLDVEGTKLAAARARAAAADAEDSDAPDGPRGDLVGVG